MSGANETENQQELCPLCPRTLSRPSPTFGRWTVGINEDLLFYGTPLHRATKTAPKNLEKFSHIVEGNLKRSNQKGLRIFLKRTLTMSPPYEKPVVCARDWDLALERGIVT
ncbi:hypothetical protein K435DRAFT_798330 [Dendrothele bispora CBS 962.96]|uniref:Uncharacterized protein n=1 Tax=Dendrothele bispora (strain CBS 962.96) TaxID=1314807 RepID=A0A4S8LZK5_DENBC|nr:hypothetical protein K435DRAFT_798330 [Dendrothele bispora CBS 962.96]